MTTLYPFKDVEDLFLDPAYASRVLPRLPEMAAWMTNTNVGWSIEMANITFYIMLRELRMLDIMPRRKTPRDTTQPVQPNKVGLGGDNAFHWLTVRLEAEDVAWLGECTDNMETIVAALLGLCDRGYGFTCKPTRKHDGFCATLLSPVSDDYAGTIALAAYGSNVRDTCLALLYKFEHCLGGTFPAKPELFNSERPRFG